MRKQLAIGLFAGLRLSAAVVTTQTYQSTHPNPEQVMILAVMGTEHVGQTASASIAGMMIDPAPILLGSRSENGSGAFAVGTASFRVPFQTGDPFLVSVTAPAALMDLQVSIAGGVAGGGWMSTGAQLLGDRQIVENPEPTTWFTVGMGLLLMALRTRLARLLCRIDYRATWRIIEGRRHART